MRLAKHPINDRKKVMDLIKYLNCTLDDFRKEAGIPRIVFESILKNESTIPIRSKFKIMKLHPEISNVWLEFGSGHMTDGMLPNKKLLKLLYRLTGTNNVDDLLNSKLVNYLGARRHSETAIMREVLTFKRQISSSMAKELSEELGFNVYRLLTLDETDLACNKSVIEQLILSLNKYKIKKRHDSNDPRPDKRMKIDRHVGGPMYRYLKGKVDDKYLDPYEMNKALNITYGRALLVHYNSISRTTAKKLADRFNLSLEDLINCNMVRDENKRSYDSRFYKMISNKMPHSDLYTLSTEIDVSHTAFKHHLNGGVMSARSAFKYSVYFEMDFSSLTREKKLYSALMSNYKKAVEKAAKP